jgi:hypothetical protein
MNRGQHESGTTVGDKSDSTQGFMENGEQTAQAYAIAG